MSLDLVYDDANIFAKIIRGEIPAARVMEDEVALAIMDAFPQSDGHTLVIPKRAKAVHLLDLPAGEIGPLMERVHRVAIGIRTALAPDGIVMTQFSGQPAGQSVFHLHVHLIPRWVGRDIAGHGRAGKADFSKLQTLARRIADALPPS